MRSRAPGGTRREPGRPRRRPPRRRCAGRLAGGVLDVWPMRSATARPPSLPASSRPSAISSSETPRAARRRARPDRPSSRSSAPGCSPRRSGFSQWRLGRGALGEELAHGTAAPRRCRRAGRARSGRTSRTARTRVGEPVWPKRLSLGRTLVDEVGRCQTEISPVWPSREIGFLRRARTTERRRGVSSKSSSPESVSPGARSVRPTASMRGDVRHVRPAEERGDLRRHLPRLRVERLPPAENEVARLPSVASASVREVPSVSATANTRSERWMQRSARAQAFPQRLLGLRRAHRHRDDLSAELRAPQAGRRRSASNVLAGAGRPRA